MMHFSDHLSYDTVVALLALYGASHLIARLLFASLLPRSPKVCKATNAFLTHAPKVPKECKPLVDAILSHDDDTMSESASAEAMRAILREGHLPFRSLEKSPSTLLRTSQHIGVGKHGGLHTRFTVNYNLFAGSIVALGSESQREELYATQASGMLGCFAFTEKGAGVMSGAACETTATLDTAKGEFVIHTPHAAAAKNWISQGCHAEWAVILANLIDGGGTDRGPHLFMARIGAKSRDGKSVVPHNGVTVGTVPPKTALVSLDNAVISFDRFHVPASALLSRYAEVDAASGRYVARLPKGCHRMEDVLISRLLTGRIVLSEYTLSVAVDLCRRSWKYVQGRELWRGKKERGKKMAEMANVQRAFADYGRCLAILTAFAASVREKVGEAISEDRFDAAAAEGCCVAKFACTSFAVDAVSAIRKVLGASALFEESRLGASSFVCYATCAAEGDNTIMELKVVGDVIRGRRPWLPCGLRPLKTAAGRAALATYARLFATALWKGRAAIKDGQLLRDIAWSRAHLMIIDAWLAQPGAHVSWLESYERVMRPGHTTPVAF